MMSTMPRSNPAGGAPVLGELRPALDELLLATGIAEAALVALVERAVVETHVRMHPDGATGGERELRARFDLPTGTLRLEEVRDHGAAVELPMSVDLQRQSAQAIKAAVAALVREAERDHVIREGAARRGDLVDAIIERQEGGLWWLRVDGMSAMLPPEEQSPGDRLERNRHLKVIALEVRRRTRDAVLVVSRSHPLLLRRLLEQEVPEMSSGQVVIRGLVREPGRRSKVAVEAVAPQIDGEGACIGPRGVRIRAVVAELGEEQVHVIGWSPDPAQLVARALGPAVVSDVELDEDSRTAHVTVPDSQLSLAIGRAGENARLAARLTGWRIDIRGDEAGA